MNPQDLIKLEFYRYYSGYTLTSCHLSITTFLVVICSKQTKVAKIILSLEKTSLCIFHLIWLDFPQDNQNVTLMFSRTNDVHLIQILIASFYWSVVYSTPLGRTRYYKVLGTMLVADICLFKEEEVNNYCSSSNAEMTDACVNLWPSVGHFSTGAAINDSCWTCVGLRHRPNNVVLI